MSDYQTYIELPITVDYDYSPAEKQIFYPNDEAYPGCDASVTINSVEIDGLKGADILPYLHADDIGWLEAHIIGHENQPPKGE